MRETSSRGEVKDKNIQVEGHGFRVRVHWVGDLKPQVLGLFPSLHLAQAELLKYPRDCYEGTLADAIRRLDRRRKRYAYLVE
jgi:hypothetical protein